jgi:hypothetical protein
MRPDPSGASDIQTVRFSARFGNMGWISIFGKDWAWSRQVAKLRQKKAVVLIKTGQFIAREVKQGGSPK